MFRFTHYDSSIKSALRRMAGEQLDKMLAAYDGADDPTQAIHELRKRSKRIRALIRLVGPAFPAFRVENAALRDAASGLSRTRDSQALIEVFDHLVAPRANGRFVRARAGLVDDCRDLTADGRDAVETFVEAARAMRLRAENWSLETSGFSALRKGLASTYGDARLGMRDARADHDPVVLHEWRKSVKYHAQHLALLRDLAPDLIPAHRAIADRLGEVLGDHHNLAVLADTLAKDMPRYASPPEHDELRGIITEASAALEEEAFALGRQLLAEKPEALIQRLHFYWKHWRKD